MATPESALRTAIVYDFDRTLAPANIQEHSLVPEHLKTTKQDFWRLVADGKRAHDADESLVYMRLQLAKAVEIGAPRTRSVLQQNGAKTPLLADVLDWFGRIDAQGRERGLALKHSVISSGNDEMIEGTSTAKEFQRILASPYRDDEEETEATSSCRLIARTAAGSTLGSRGFLARLPVTRPGAEAGGGG